jgi:membrane-associated protease RseP (regulator of RpoE activity)
MKRRLLPPSRTKPMDPDASYFERVMRTHFQEVNDERPRRRISRRAKSYWDATVYGAGIVLLLVLLGIFSDI